MDILAARKKAAEKVKSRQEPETASPAGAENSAPGGPEEQTTAPVPQPSVVEAAVPEVSSAGEREKPPEAETPPPAETTKEMELLSFRLGGEEYAVMVDEVREVLKRRDLTSVPNTPEHILGVMSLRGAMLTVIDLGRKLGLAPVVQDDRTRIIVVNPGEEDVGLLVDRVTGVLKIAPEEVKPPPENIEQGAEFLRGIVRKDDRLVILLDLQRAVGI